MVEITTYLVNMSDFAGYNDVYSNIFRPTGRRAPLSPCSACPGRAS